MLTQSDRGSENYGIANAQTFIRQKLDANLTNTLQHRFLTGHINVKPEIFWGQLRRRWTPGFEDLLDYGLLNGLYDPQDGAQK